MAPVAKREVHKWVEDAAAGASPFRTLPELLLHVTRRWSRTDALNYPAVNGLPGRWLSVSHAELRERVEHLALGLVDLGLRRGESVGLIAPSSPWWLVVDLAIQAAGGVSVPLFKRISAESFTHELQDSGMRYLFVGNPDEMRMALQHAAAAGRSRDPQSGSLPRQGPASSGTETAAGPAASGMETAAGVSIVTFWFEGQHERFEELLRRGRQASANDPRLFEQLCRQVREDDLATIIYTSGSTGLPKGVELTQHNLVTQVRGCSQVFDATPAADRCLSVLPPEHIFERMVLYFYLASGVPVYFVDDPKRVTDYLRSVQPTIMTVVPRILEKVAIGIRQGVSAARGPRGLIARAAVRRAERRDPGSPAAPIDRLWQRLVYRRLTEALGGRLRYLICGSARLDPAVARMLINVGVPVYEGYGLTEASPVLAVNFLGNRKVGTVGKPFPGVEVRIGPDGEILARGPNIMRCYHSEPAATAEVLDSDGWLHTGDLGSIDEEGYLVIEGRKKELFKKSTGEYVPPGPIEEALGRVPWVDTAVVIADGRTCAVALLFPDPAKLLELREAAGMADLDERQFLQSSWLRERAQQEIDRINAHLHHAERVERFAIMDHPAGVETGELTPTLKRRRFAIERQYAATIEDLYRTVGGWK